MAIWGQPTFLSISESFAFILLYFPLALMELGACLVCWGRTFWAQVRTFGSRGWELPLFLLKCFGTHGGPYQTSRAHEKVMSLLRVRISELWVAVSVAGSLSDLVLWMEGGLSGGLLNGEACVKRLPWKSGVDGSTLLEAPWCGTSYGCS